MTISNAIDVGCTLFDEFVEEADLPENVTFNKGEPVRPHILIDYLDELNQDDGCKEFTVLLMDGRVAAVRGHGLRVLPSTETGDGLLYGIVTRTATEEVFVALFRGSDVVGIFHGEIRLDRKIA